jgi:hypothetical protein
LFLALVLDVSLWRRTPSADYREQPRLVALAALLMMRDREIAETQNL